jgi:hypothetical protein
MTTSHLVCNEKEISLLRKYQQRKLDVIHFVTNKEDGFNPKTGVSLYGVSENEPEIGIGQGFGLTPFSLPIYMS